MKALDALRGDAADPRAPGLLTNIATAVLLIGAGYLLFAYFWVGQGGRLLP